MAEKKINLALETAFEIIKQHCTTYDTKLHVADCSMCKYPVGWIWLDGKLYYDAGCDCLHEYLLEPREEKDLKDYMLNNPGRIEKMHDFFTRKIN